MLAKTQARRLLSRAVFPRLSARSLPSFLAALSSRTRRPLPGTARASCSQRRFWQTAGGNMSSLEELVFENRVLKSLPIDSEAQNYVRTVSGACFSRVLPTPVSQPQLVAHSQSALDLLGLSPDQVSRPEFVEYFCGNKVLPGSEPASHCYCGHQFGHFAGQLGDGCAHYLGEVVGSGGQRWELQLKGSGKTPYSRFADGRKVLRSSIREFLCSEAMHFLGIPTTRAGTCITSDDTVTRDIKYDGHPIQERCTVISRIAPSFIRFGSFEIFKTRDRETGRVGPSVGREDILHQLLDFVTASYYPQACSQYPEDRSARTAVFFREVCVRTAHLVSAWQCVGFCHGVLNTDNMSILGLTIDYGPYGFMDRYDPGHICNGSDDRGRYAYDQQPKVCRWNLSKLAEVLSPCLSQEATLEGLRHGTSLPLAAENALLERCPHFKAMALSQLGLLREEEDDGDLIEALLDTMHVTGCDFTNGFHCLSRIQIHENQEAAERELEEVVELLLAECASPQEMIQSHKPRMPPHQLHMLLQLMEAAPEILQALGMSPDYLKQEIVKMEKADKIKEMSGDEKRSGDRALWLKWLSRYSARLHQELGTATDLSKANKERLTTMRENNPRFILRNHILQTAIEHAEKGDYSEVQRVYQLLQIPYQYPNADTGAAVPGTKATDSVTETQSPSTLLHTTTTDDDDAVGGSKAEAEREGVTKEDEERAVGVAAKSEEISRYYSKPPDWALDLCVT